MALTTLLDWMTFLSGTERQYEDGDLTLHAYGEADRTHVVLERSTDEAPLLIDQYIVGAPNSPNPLFALMRTLGGYEFDFATTARAIIDAEYTVSPDSEVATWGEMTISRFQLKINQP